MSKELPSNVRRLGQRRPLTGVDVAIRDLEEFPVGLLDDSEIEIFATARAALEEAQDIAIRKGIELGFSVRKPSVWDRFRRAPQHPVGNREREVKYKGLPVQVLADNFTSIASDTQCRIARFQLDPNLEYDQYGPCYFIPYSAKFREAYYVSWYGINNDFLAFGDKERNYPSYETLVQLKEYQGAPIFIVNAKKDEYGGTKPAGVYTLEPTDPVKEIYHVGLEFPNNNFLLEVRSTGRKEMFEVRELRAITK